MSRARYTHTPARLQRRDIALARAQASNTDRTRRRMGERAKMSDDGGRTGQQKKNQGGYDCEFVTQPPDAFQVECPVCLQILREPCLISCPCGQKICRECVEQIKEDDKPCPLCNKTDFTYIRDYGLERYLKAQEVWCSHKNDGCEWRGKLGEYERHLNEDPSPENQLTGCQFVAVECVHGCGKWFQRRHIASHQKGVCPKRPFACEYCNEYESTFEDVTKNHYPQCIKYPVTCPNRCRDAPFERQNVKNHVKDECPLAEIDCPLHYAGCEVRLPRKDMPEHMTDTVTHLTLLATVTQSLLKENQELRQLETKQKATEACCNELNEKQKTTEKKCQDLEAKLKVTENELRETKVMVGGYPIDFHFNHGGEEDSIYLPSFYTHSRHGYRMCIRVYPKGCGDGKTTHLSLFAYLMKGEYDDYLKWPFRGEITVQIVNQAGDHSHVEKTTPYDDKAPDICASRVTNTDKSEGWGKIQFMARTDLEYNAAKKTQYLKDGIIIVRVVKVIITQ